MARVSRHLLSTGAVSASLLVTVTGLAQNASRPNADVLADLEACSTLERDRARLACFDGVLAAERSGTPSSEPANGDASPTPSAAAEPKTAARAPATPEPRTAAAAPATPDEAPRRREPADEREDRDDNGRRTVTIVEINDRLPGQASFLTDTGQLYIQTSGGTPSGGYPDVPYEATLRDGALGSLFLYISERRRVRVRRAE